VHAGLGGLPCVDTENDRRIRLVPGYLRGDFFGKRKVDVLAVAGRQSAIGDDRGPRGYGRVIEVLGRVSGRQPQVDGKTMSVTRPDAVLLHLESSLLGAVGDLEDFIPRQQIELLLDGLDDLVD